jgi:hypothetical protein
MVIITILNKTTSIWLVTIHTSSSTDKNYSHNRNFNFNFPNNMSQTVLFITNHNLPQQSALHQFPVQLLCLFTDGISVCWLKVISMWRVEGLGKNSWQNFDGPVSTDMRRLTTGNVLRNESMAISSLCERHTVYLHKTWQYSLLHT